MRHLSKKQNFYFVKNFRLILLEPQKQTKIWGSFFNNDEQTTALLKELCNGTPIKPGQEAECQDGALQKLFTTYMETKPTTIPK